MKRLTLLNVGSFLMLAIFWWLTSGCSNLGPLKDSVVGFVHRVIHSEESKDSKVDVDVGVTNVTLVETNNLGRSPVGDSN